MDNFNIDVTSQDGPMFRSALSIAFAGNAPGGNATHWWKADDQCEVRLYWHEVEGAVPLPYPMDVTASGDLLWSWLCSELMHRPLHHAGLRSVDRHKQRRDHPGDFDGSIGNLGWRVFKPDWNDPYIICAVVRVWAWYSK